MSTVMTNKKTSKKIDEKVRKDQAKLKAEKYMKDARDRAKAKSHVHQHGHHER